MSFQPGFDHTLTPSPSTKVIVLEGDQILTFQSSVFLSYQQLQALNFQPEAVHHLGYLSEAPCFVCTVNSVLPIADPDFEFSGLRGLLTSHSASEIGAAGRALQVVHWRKTHRYCGCCGSPTHMHPTEHALVCSRCGHMSFPKIAPCVIGLVWRGDQCLLAHNARFREGRYSILAGFIEAGETAEQALAREVKEEVGLEIHPPQYVASQSWPFPSQLMLGFFAEYKSGEIREDGVEILHAGWYRHDNLPDIPPAETIAGWLIQQFFEGVQTG